MKSLTKIVASLTIVSTLFFFSPPPYAQAAQTFATWNSSDKNAVVTLSNFNLTALSSSGTPVWAEVRSTVSVSSGKWYWEVHYDTYLNGASMIGIGNSTASLANFFGSDANGLSYYAQNTQSQYYFNNVPTNISGTGSTGVYIGVALDMDNHQVTFYNNCVAATPSALALGASMTGAVFAGFSSNFNSPTNPTVTANFGASAFNCTVPSGYNSGLYTGSASASFNIWQFFGF